MPWGAVAGAVIGAYASNKASKSAAGAASSASNSSIAEQQRQYDQTRQDQLPWLNAGSNALSQMQALNSGDFSSFKQSPDYQFAYDQGMQSLDRSAAARGGLYSGGHSADLMKFGQGLASQNYGTFYNRLQSLANQGQTTGSGLGALGASAASNIGNAYTNAGNARTSAYMNQGNNYAGLAATGANAFGNWYQNNRTNNPGGTGWYLGNNPGKG
jgi:hypothetical protein